MMLIYQNVKTERGFKKELTREDQYQPVADITAALWWAFMGSRSPYGFNFFCHFLKCCRLQHTRLKVSTSVRIEFQKQHGCIKGQWKEASGRRQICQGLRCWLTLKMLQLEWKICTCPEAVSLNFMMVERWKEKSGMAGRKRTELEFPVSF